MTRRNDGLTTGMSNAEALRALRADAVARGLCQECRCRSPRDGVKTCDVCLQRAKDRVEERRLRGKCDCGRRPVRGKAACRRCIDDRIPRDARRYAKRVNAGVCPRCNKAPPAPNRKQCAACLDAMAALAMRLYIERTPDARPWMRRCSVCHELGHLASRHTRAVAP